MLILVGILSFCAYFNFGRFHFGNYVHYWDTYHYYVGSKYFNELSYDRLYECASVADSEDPTLRRRVELRKIMNLRTNVLGGTTDILAHPERCKEHFTAERWEKFKKDIEFFRIHHGVKRWEEAQTDHGYNATPVWNIVGTTLANLTPASETQVRTLTMIDPAFIFGHRRDDLVGVRLARAVRGSGGIRHQFPVTFLLDGWGVSALGLVVLHDRGGVSSQEAEADLGGYFLAYSALLRVFPGFVFVGPVFVVVQQLLDQTKGRKWWQRLPPRELPAMLRRVDRGHLAVILGGALAVGTLVPLSLVTSNGLDGYRMFLKNSEKHTVDAADELHGLADDRRLQRAGSG